MGDTARRTTRASVNEQLSAEKHEDKSAGSELNFEDFVRNSLSVLGSKLDTIIVGQAELEKRVINIETKVNSNITEIKEVIRSVEYESENIKNNADQILDLKDQIQRRETELDSARSTISSMETDLNSLERYTRSFNFRILGLPERKDENCVDSVHQILNDKFGIATTVIENAHRVGLSRDDKPRQMIARFYSRATRRAVMTSARETLQNTGMRFIDDLTQKDLDEKRRLKPLMDKLYNDNKRPRFLNGRLYAEGRAVSRETINSFLATVPATSSSR